MKKDLLNIKFNRLLVLNEHGRNKHGQVLWECLCDCGNKKEAITAELISGHIKSCGCLYIENTKTASITHGMANTLIYRTWDGIKQRCTNIKCNAYPDYGGRGIKMCDRWLNSFENFLADMGNKPSKKHSIERVNMNGDYEPSNCIWSTMKEQSRNKRNNKWVEFSGKKMILADWGIYLGLKGRRIYYYFDKGYSIEGIIKKLDLKIA